MPILPDHLEVHANPGTGLPGDTRTVRTTRVVTPERAALAALVELLATTPEYARCAALWAWRVDGVAWTPAAQRIVDALQQAERVLAEDSKKP